MRELKIFLIFIGALFLDGLVLPALFGLQESFLVFITIILPLLYFSAAWRLMILGFALILGIEIYGGFPYGHVSIPYLATALLVSIAQNFFEVKYDYYSRFSPFRMIATSVLTVGAIYVFSAISSRSLVGSFTPGMYAIILLETAVMIVLFGAVFKKNDFDVRE